MAEIAGRHRVRRGLTLPFEQSIPETVEPGPGGRFVALLAADYTGLRPRMRVQEGDAVRRGTLLFEDGAEGVRYTSPAAGTVAAIHRGDRRALQSVVIELDESERTEGAQPAEERYASFTDKPVSALRGEQVRDLLVESGQWTAFRKRPFEKVPSPATSPRAVFVIAVDTNPLAPDPGAVLAGHRESWTAGLEALAKLTDGGTVHLCTGPDARLDGSEVEGVSRHEIAGPHPAGTPGMAMHLIEPVQRNRVSWHIGYQDVVAIGHLLRFGKLLVDRTISLAGPQVGQPRLIRTRIGASVDALTENALDRAGTRIISGSVLNGREAAGEVHGYLGRYHNQVTALPQADERRMLGWLGPGLDRFSVLRLFAARLAPWRKPRMSTDSYGGERAMVPLGLYEKVWPFDLLATPLLRALLSKDLESAEELGCLELSEEDVAVCSFVCPSKIDYGQALRNMLDRIEEEG